MENLDECKSWERAYARFLTEGFKYGDHITDIWLYESFDIPYPGPQVPYSEATKSTLAALNARNRLFKELLSKHQMAVVSTRDGGYRIILPKDQTEHAVSDARDGFKKVVDRMQTWVTNVNMAELSDGERKENADASVRATMLAGLMKSVWPRRKNVT